MIPQKKTISNVPKMLHNSEYHADFPIMYAPDVAEDEKIPGLIAFLAGEYDRILSTRGDFLLDTFLSLDENGRLVAENERVIVTDERGNLLSDTGALWNREFIWPAIPVVLKKEMPDKEYHHNGGDMAGMITECKEKCEDAQLEKEHTWRAAILGEYCGDGRPEYASSVFTLPYGGKKPYIIIYYRNVNCPNEEDYKAIMGNCLAHEYFHFLHNWFAEKNFDDVIPERDKVVEALADFYALIHTLFAAWMSADDNTAKLKYAQQRYEEWWERKDSDWPYAYARCFLPDYNKNEKYAHVDESIFGREEFENVKKKFKKVFYQSKENTMKWAFECLEDERLDENLQPLED